MINATDRIITKKMIDFQTRNSTDINESKPQK
jgi:hypothetical protein